MWEIEDRVCLVKLNEIDDKFVQVGVRMIC
jgi:hypothetical protein